ncbi:hypothetical protein GCM10022251_16620 [Phytohabitans flavus]|uniref:Uncharacterized protein n=1 Tax=Phytohabitans flavus TaxID=1076124 RepID=A0A6F8Y645_9ACTN|nr:hypothetical protein [Phytohabitans flavus]BCB81586.1 hypothetical protein Pflav_079960 [Phytohabitans flavus]
MGTDSDTPRGGDRRWIGHLAGWLFADLLLVLFIITLASAPIAPMAALDPSPSPETAAASPSLSPSPTATPGPPALELDAVTFDFTVNVDALMGGRSAASSALVAEFKRKLRAERLAGREAGFMLTFGYAEQPGYRNSLGRNLAQKVNEVVVGSVPGFERARFRSYWSQGPVGKVQIQVFFFEAR